MRVSRWFLIGMLFSTQVRAAETVVTTYVTKVQEERESTRFTLTEWLRIKERMKLMDVWLAMFSDPQKDKFRPELNLIYLVTKGAATTSDENTMTESGTLDGNVARGQLWLTNIFTGSTGIKMVNIDFGLDAGLRQTESFAPDTPTSTLVSRRIATEQYAAAFRLFGKSIQDSSIVAKAGKYSTSNGAISLFGQSTAAKATGNYFGGELQLYLFRWLGLEGSYSSYGKANLKNSDDSISGSYADYFAYIEISLLRVMGGAYSESWNVTSSSGSAKMTNKGLAAGVKIQF